MLIIKNRIPNAGSAKDMMRRLQSYINPIDPDWLQNLKPSSEETIKKWERKLHLEEKKLKFPSSYLEFLRHAGEEDGGLFENTLHAKMGLESQLAYKWRIGINESDVLHPYCFEFIETMDLGIPYTMNLAENNEKIFVDMSVEFSSSFENLLFQCAVEIYEKKYFSSYVNFISNEDRFFNLDILKQGKALFPIIDKIVEENSLQKAWFSDDLFYFAYSDKMSLLINGREAGFRGMIFFNEKGDIVSVENGLISKIGAVIYY